MLRHLDMLARRYGRWPHEVLDLDPEALTLAAMCAQMGIADGLKRIEQAGMVFPVCDVMG